MLEALFPLSFVAFTVWPHEDTLTVFVVVAVLADVLPPVWPAKHSNTVHFIVHPSTLVNTLVSPRVSTLATDLIIVELANVAAAISPVKLTRPVLLPIHKLAFECGAVGPLLSAEAILIISVELSDVPATIRMHINALTTSLSLTPYALVTVTVGMDQATRSTSLAIPPEAFVS